MIAFAEVSRANDGYVLGAPAVPEIAAILTPPEASVLPHNL